MFIYDYALAIRFTVHTNRYKHISLLPPENRRANVLGTRHTTRHCRPTMSVRVILTLFYRMSGRVSRSADTRPTAGSIAWLLGRQAMPYFWLMSAVCSHWRLTMSVNNVGGQNDDGQRRPTITVTTIHHLQETITLNKPSTVQSQLNHTTVQRCACVSDEHKFCQLLVTNYTAPFCWLCVNSSTLYTTTKQLRK